jgi:hypothetical protein
MRFADYRASRAGANVLTLASVTLRRYKQMAGLGAKRAAGDLVFPFIPDIQEIRANSKKPYTKHTKNNGVRPYWDGEFRRCSKEDARDHSLREEYGSH